MREGDDSFEIYHSIFAVLTEEKPKGSTRERRKPRAKEGGEEGERRKQV